MPRPDSRPPTDSAQCPLGAVGDTFVALMQRNFQRPRPDGSLPRILHDKAHACLNGTFTVESPADPTLRQGLFAAPGRYDAFVRFSSGLLAEDRHPDSRGLAIKLRGVPGEVCDGAPEGQQDFLMINATTLPAKTVDDSIAFFQALDGIKRVTPFSLIMSSYLMPGLRPWRIRWDCLKSMLSVAIEHARTPDLSRMVYHSILPYRFGPYGAMTFQCRPVPPATQPRARGRSFAEKLQSRLDDGPILFDFLVRLRRSDAESLELDGPAWTGPYQRVAQLTLPPQPVRDTIDRGERVAFSPWNALRAHEPLGSINDLRRRIYAASATARGADATFPTDTAD